MTSTIRQTGGSQPRVNDAVTAMNASSPSRRLTRRMRPVSQLIRMPPTDVTEQTATPDDDDDDGDNNNNVQLMPTRHRPRHFGPRTRSTIARRQCTITTRAGIKFARKKSWRKTTAVTLLSTTSSAAAAKCCRYSTGSGVHFSFGRRQARTLNEA